MSRLRLEEIRGMDALARKTAVTSEISTAVAAALASIASDLLPPGVISPYGGTSAPTGWLLCDGTAVSRTGANADLFAIVGTAFGAGDGSTTFNLPDLRQRFPLGKAAAGTGATLGGTGGLIDHVHNLDTATSHAKISSVASAGLDPASLRKTVAGYQPTHDGSGTGAATALGTTTTGTALGGDSDVANPPFQAVNYIVKL